MGKLKHLQTKERARHSQTPSNPCSCGGGRGGAAEGLGKRPTNAGHGDRLSGESAQALAVQPPPKDEQIQGNKGTQVKAETEKAACRVLSALLVWEGVPHIISSSRGGFSGVPDHRGRPALFAGSLRAHGSHGVAPAGPPSPPLLLCSHSQKCELPGAGAVGTSAAAPLQSPLSRQAQLTHCGPTSGLSSPLRVPRPSTPTVPTKPTPTP